jgi:hypothetical protein
MKWTDRYVARDCCEAQRDIKVLVNVPASRFNFLRLRVTFQRRAALAGAISLLLRLRGRIKKFHVLALWPPAGA